MFEKLKPRAGYLKNMWRERLIHLGKSYNEETLRIIFGKVSDFIKNYIMV